MHSMIMTQNCDLHKISLLSHNLQYWRQNLQSIVVGGSYSQLSVTTSTDNSKDHQNTAKKLIDRNNGHK